MESLLTKSEFLERLIGAVDMYVHRSKQKKFSEKRWEVQIDIAALTAQGFKLPAFKKLEDPITRAVYEIRNVHAYTKDPLRIMMYAEAAWEHMLNDQQARAFFKRLNR